MFSFSKLFYIGLFKKYIDKLNKNYTRMLFSTILGCSTQQNISCMATYLPSHNHLSRTNMTCWILLVKWGCTHKWRSFMDSHTWTRQCWPINKDLHTTALCGHSMQSGRPAMDNRGGWRKESGRLDDDYRSIELVRDAYTIRGEWRLYYRMW